MIVPDNPPIFHITHVDNLPGILREGGLWCDAERAARSLVNTNIGHSHIKERRLRRSVPTATGRTLGQYVPFNFCSRSIMLYAVHRGHQDYDGGQDDIVHLVTTVRRAVEVARGWAFTDRHAELAHALYYDNLDSLSEVPWEVMTKTYWSDVKEERQAEFLVFEFFPWEGVDEVATKTPATAQRVREVLGSLANGPAVTVRREWYYS